MQESVRNAIPVLRMLDASAMRSFYVDYLGFEVDWQKRFSDAPDSPLCMQLHKGDAFIHLDGHAALDRPVSEVRLPLYGLESYCEHLRSLDCGFGDVAFEKPELADLRGSGTKTDMRLVDPSGNVLVFWKAVKPGLALGEEFYTRAIFAVSDVQRSVAYYQECLGFQMDWEFAGEGASLAQVSRNGLALILNGMSAMPRPDGPSTLSLTLHEPGGLGALHRSLSERGARIVKAPFQVVWDASVHQCEVADLDGNVLVFWGDGG